MDHRPRLHSAAIIPPLLLVFTASLSCSGGELDALPPRSLGAGGAVGSTAGGGGAAGAGVAQSGSAGVAGAAGSAGAIADPMLPLPASDIAIAEVALFQGPKVPLMAQGDAIQSPLAQVIRGRDGLLRLYVQPLETWSPREVLARVSITSDDTESFQAEVQQAIESASTEANLASTINVAVPGAAIGTNAKYSVELFELPNSAVVAGDVGAARWPHDGMAPMHEQATNEALRIVLVPWAYQADGSGRVPDLAAGVQKQILDKMYALYPSPRIDVTVHDPVPFTEKISPVDDNAWSDLFDATLSLRAKEKPDPDVYYYGIVAPAPTLQTYCKTGCIGGLGPGFGKTFAAIRAAVGIGYPSTFAEDTFVQEIGHAHGIDHAPCGGATGADKKYPYAKAKIGSWGYDLVTKGLRAPDKFYDMMSYCEPTWISDYNFGKLAAEMRYVNKVARQSSEVGRYRISFVGEGGEAELGPAVHTSELPIGEPRRVALLGGGGKVVRNTVATFVRYSRGSRGVLIVPDHAEAVAVRVLPQP